MRTRYVVPLLVMVAAAVGLYGCVSSKLPNVSLTDIGEAASPPVLAPMGQDPAVSSASEWQARRAPLLRKAFQEDIYGRWPDPTSVRVKTKTVLSPSAYDGTARIEQWDIALGEPQSNRGFSLLVVLPLKAKGPVPLIIMENFCGNVAAYPEIKGVAAPRLGRPKECDNKWVAPLVPLILGDAIKTPPTRRIMEAGYALAMFHAGEVVPDNPQSAERELLALTPPGTPPEQRTGAVAAWAWLYGRVMDVASDDARFDPKRMVLWGHSRDGKAALLAAAMDARPAAIVALQSGTGGASLGRDDQGETISSVTSHYPHWFAPAFKQLGLHQSNIPVDQHQLLALIAPRPVLLAGGRRDAWSDPNGAIRAAEGASPVYALFGATAFVQGDRMTPNLAHPLVTYMRPGLHGIHGSDWTRTLEFLDHWVKPGR
jgi:hypothetical protein